MKSTKLISGTKFSIFYILSCAVVCLTGGCDNANGNLQPLIINPTLIGKGDLNGNGAENILKQNVIVTNQNDWTALIHAMNTVNNVSDSFTEIDIDFNSFQIVTAFDNVKPNGGHSIDITDVTVTESNITVTVQNLLTGGLNSVITQPFHIVKIPKSPKQIVFIAG